MKCPNCGANIPESNTSLISRGRWERKYFFCLKCNFKGNWKMRLIPNKKRRKW